MSPKKTALFVLDIRHAAPAGVFGPFADPETARAWWNDYISEIWDDPDDHPTNHHGLVVELPALCGLLPDGTVHWKED